jgi:hypothetical protein
VVSRGLFMWSRDHMIKRPHGLFMWSSDHMIKRPHDFHASHLQEYSKYAGGLLLGETC